MFSRSAAPAANVANPANGLSPLRDRMERIADTLIYNFQDRFKPLRDIQKRLVPASEEEDAVLAEERYSGIVRARTNDFHQALGLGPGMGIKCFSFESVWKTCTTPDAPSIRSLPLQRPKRFAQAFHT